MLIMELEDLQDDIQLALDAYKADYDQSRISAEVFYRNAELKQSELAGVKGLYERTLKISSEDYGSVEAMVVGLESWLQEWCHSAGLKGNVQALVNRKTEKVFTYFERTTAMA